MNAEEGIAHGVLTQEWGGQRKRIAYLSKLLDIDLHCHLTSGTSGLPDEAQLSY